LSAGLILPAALVVAAEIEMTGAVPPEETMGAVAVTPVTVPKDGDIQDKIPLALVDKTCPFVPLVAGNVKLVFVPFLLISNVPPMVVLAFFKMVRALLLVGKKGSPLPITKRRSTAFQSVALVGV
jgi:hypothetical protein